MQEAKPWHEQNTFWETVASTLFTQRRWSDALAEVEQVVSLLGIEPGAQVLDLCCGVGRHSLELARRGFQVTGVDRTRLYLDRASRQAEAEGLMVESQTARRRALERSRPWTGCGAHIRSSAPSPGRRCGAIIQLKGDVQ